MVHLGDIADTNFRLCPRLREKVSFEIQFQQLGRTGLPGRPDNVCFLIREL